MEVYTLDEILDELENRYPFGIIVAGARPTEVGKTDGTDYMMRFRGISLACLGLCGILKTAIIHHLASATVREK